MHLYTTQQMHLVDEQHPTPNNTEEIITKRHFSYVQELPHPSKLRYLYNFKRK